MNTKIGGCVILYNPIADVIGNIKTYYTDLDTLIIIDNSPVQNVSLINTAKELSAKIIYRWMGGNQGIAKALNEACSMAIENNCEWLLTMDQDSYFNDGDLNAMIVDIASVKTIFPNTGIISPYHEVDKKITPNFTKKYTTLRTCMTSGNLLHLTVWLFAGPFEKKFFIDYVDHEYCLRLRKHQFRVVQNNQIRLNHSLGNFEVRTLLNKKIGTSNHGPQRRYYIVRNGLYTVKKYFLFDPVFCFAVLRNIFYDFFRILLFEKGKWAKCKASFIGAYHACINRLGKYEGIKDTV